VKPTSLLRKEILSAKNRLPALLVLLVLVPAVFAGASLAFDDVIPRDAPVAVVPADEDVTQDELDAVGATLSVLADPVTYDDPSGQKRALAREEVYAVVEVPSDFVDDGGTFVVHAHGAVVPFDEPSKLLVSVLDSGLRATGSDVTVERNIVGDDKDLSEYLLPVLLTVLVFVLGLVYVPHDLRRERRALERLRLETSLVSVVLTKVLFYAALLSVPIAVFEAAAQYLGYGVSFVSIPSVVFLLVTFVYMSFLGTAVTLAARFSAYGRLLNVVILFGTLVLSNIIYPVGFFSSLRRDVAVLTPTHHSALAVRSHATKDIPATLFADSLVPLVGFTVVTFVVLVLATRRYES
jgi:ABC-2 type transport system permease protein